MLDLLPPWLGGALSRHLSPLSRWASRRLGALTCLCAPAWGRAGRVSSGADIAPHLVGNGHDRQLRARLGVGA